MPEDLYSVERVRLAVFGDSDLASWSCEEILMEYRAAAETTPHLRQLYVDLHTEGARAQDVGTLSQISSDIDQVLGTWSIMRAMQKYNLSRARLALTDTYISDVRRAQLRQQIHDLEMEHGEV